MADTPSGTSMWGGRFAESTDEFVQQFTASIPFDHRLAQQDIRGSIAHATMLAEVGVLSESDKDAILEGLTRLAAKVEQNDIQWSVALEDVHMNLEYQLTQDIGDAGKRLHTARSRNDQVATDVRLWTRDHIDLALAEIKRLMQGCIALAEQYADVIMPGFTHLQTAQPVTFGHHVLAWFEMLYRDATRLQDCRRRLNQSPLGAAALAGSPYPINRHRTAELLGFDAPCANSLDAVSDRDFAIEFCSVAATCMVHLSRMSEELVIWTSAQFGFVNLPDRFCTGSSIMPQKKNPDVPELVRGKSGRALGNLNAMLMLMKAQPLAYNKDNQEDKEPLFDSVETLINCLRAFADMVPHITPNADQMRAAAMKGYATATDLADYLVRTGLPFREAHEVVGNAVAIAVKEGVDLSELSIETLQSIHSAIEPDVYDVLSLEGSVNSRDHFGGTAPNQVRQAAQAAKQRVASL